MGRICFAGSWLKKLFPRDEISWWWWWWWWWWEDALNIILEFDETLDDVGLVWAKLGETHWRDSTTVTGSSPSYSPTHHIQYRCKTLIIWGACLATVAVMMIKIPLLKGRVLKDSFTGGCRSQTMNLTSKTPTNQILDRYKGRKHVKKQQKIAARLSCQDRLPSLHQNCQHVAMKENCSQKCCPRRLQMFQSPGWLSAVTRCRCQRQKSVKNQGNSALGNRWNYDDNSGNGNDHRWISLPQGTNCPMQLLPSSPARFLLFQIIKIQSGIFLHALL